MLIWLVRLAKSKYLHWPLRHAEVENESSESTIQFQLPTSEACNLSPTSDLPAEINCVDGPNHARRLYRTNAPASISLRHSLHFLLSVRCQRRFTAGRRSFVAGAAALATLVKLQRARLRRRPKRYQSLSSMSGGKAGSGCAVDFERAGVALIQPTLTMPDNVQ